MTSNQFEMSVCVNGRPIREYGHRGLTFVEGRKNQNYTIKFRNNSARRVLAVISVDGVSAVDGKPADNDSRGYIVPAYSSAEIKGWRTSKKETHKFVFDTKHRSNSAQQQGEDTNCGVVAAKVFDEKVTLAQLNNVLRLVTEKHHHYHHYHHDLAIPIPSCPPIISVFIREIRGSIANADLNRADAASTSGGNLLQPTEGRYLDAELVGGFENGVGGAVVLFELDDFDVPEMLLQVEQVGDLPQRGPCGVFDAAEMFKNGARQIKLLGAQYIRGIVYKRQGDFRKAIESLKRVVAGDPQCLGAYYNLAMCYKAAEQYTNAMATLNAALQHEPNNPSCHYQLITLHRRVGNLEHAARHAETFDRLKDAVAESEKPAEALERMEKGTYGICRDCGEPIAPARLDAIPWTRVCITCKEKQNQ